LIRKPQRTRSVFKELGLIMAELLAAVFEGGVFRPTTPPHLNEGEAVEILVRPRTSLPPKAVAAALATAASFPVERVGDPNTSRDHDRVLYDEAQSP